MRHESSLRLGAALETFCRKQGDWARRFVRLGAAAVLILSASAGAIHGQANSTAPDQRRAVQRKPASPAAKVAPQKAEDDLNWLLDILKNRELMAEAGRLLEKLQKGIQYPAARNQSRILPRLSESTVFYLAVPNYGETMHQALQIFQQELKESAPLRDFLQKNKLDAAEPKLENGIQKFYEFSQYLGDEIVITGGLKGQDPDGVMVAELKRPGVKEFLEKLNDEVFTNQPDHLRILDPQQLAAAGEKDATQGPVVLVRPDLIAVGSSVAALRKFDSQIDASNAKFASNALGQMLTQAYQGGANTLLGVDLRKILSLVPPGKPQDRLMLEKSGFADVNYLVAGSTVSAEGSTNQGEVTFNGPRRGIASWVASPAPMGALDFMSTHPATAADAMLKSPAQVFDELREIMGASAFATLPQMEARLNVNLKQDVLSKLGGEIAVEVKAPPMSQSSDAGLVAHVTGVAFKVILSVTDPAALQQTLTRLLAVAPFEMGQREEDGVIFHTLTPQSQGPPTEINYFFMDGYLVITTDRAEAREAVRAHRSGASLAKSSALRDSLVRGQSPEASLMVYQDPGPMLSSMLSQAPAELRALIPAGGEITTRPNVVRVYAGERSFRGVTNSSVQADASVALIVAAIAIPNLLRARVAANEAAAMASVRTVNTAEITYSTSYPAKGYAPSLATLGSGASGGCTGNNATATHACLLDDVLGNAKCTAGEWCEKSGYKFSVRAVCGPAVCRTYVVTATPVNAGSGGKSFCSTTDAVVRSHAGPPLEAPLTAAQCRAWEPIQ
jgi:type IV pilus assembly protein PilA